MATLEENIRKIRGEAIYGKDVREAIAEGLMQMDDAIIADMNSYKISVEETKNTAIQTINSKASTSEQAIESKKNSAISTMNSKASTSEQAIESKKNSAISTMNSTVAGYTARVDAYDSRLDTMQHDIDDRDLFMRLSDLGNGDYKLLITNAS